MIVFKNFLYKVLTILPFLQIGNFEIDEDLDNYFDSVDKDDKDWSIKEELNARKNL